MGKAGTWTQSSAARQQASVLDETRGRYGYGEPSVHLGSSYEDSWSAYAMLLLNATALLCTARFYQQSAEAVWALFRLSGLHRALLYGHTQLKAPLRLARSTEEGRTDLMQSPRWHKGRTFH